jgi:hypothetical protein
VRGAIGIGHPDPSSAASHLLLSLGPRGDATSDRASGEQVLAPDRPASLDTVPANELARRPDVPRKLDVAIKLDNPLPIDVKGPGDLAWLSYSASATNDTCSPPAVIDLALGPANVAVNPMGAKNDFSCGTSPDVVLNVVNARAWVRIRCAAGSTGDAALKFATKTPTACPPAPTAICLPSGNCGPGVKTDVKFSSPTVVLVVGRATNEGVLILQIATDDGGPG